MTACLVKLLDRPLGELFGPNVVHSYETFPKPYQHVVANHSRASSVGDLHMLVGRHISCNANDDWYRNVTKKTGKIVELRVIASWRGDWGWQKEKKKKD